MNQPLDDLDREQLMALVKSVRGKQSRKGAGKGGKGRENALNVMQKVISQASALSGSNG